MKLAGKVAIITGGGRGIGQAGALEFAREGASVVISDIAEHDEVKDTLVQIEALGGKGIFVQADVGDEDQVIFLVDHTVETFGQVDILVNCAGINLRHPAVDYPEADWRRTLEMNLTVPFLLSQAAGRAMIESGRGGSIINVGSLACMASRPSIPSYTAAKGGLAQLTKALAVEWAKHNIRVNAIAPGYIHTEMTRPLYEDEEFSRFAVSRTPAGRWGEPEDLVGPTVMLASEAGGFVTGQVIYVDGGFTASL